MINGAHFLLYSKDPDADRAFLAMCSNSGLSRTAVGADLRAPTRRDRGSSIDEDAPQPIAEGEVVGASIYLMCDDLDSTIKSLESKNVLCSEVNEAPWGIVTTFRLPSGGEIGLYQPTHPTALESH